jgi:hypothetical protein
MSAVVTPSPARSQEGSVFAPLTLSRIPRPDYRNHPAYGGAFPRPSVRRRLQALGRLLPWMAFVAARRLLLYDRLESLPDYQAPMTGGLGQRLRALPRVLPYILRGQIDHWRRLLFGGTASQVAVNPPFSDTFARYGIATTRLPATEMARIEAQVATPLAELLEQRARAGSRTFEGNQRFLNHKGAADLFVLLDEILSQHGVLDAAERYLGRPVKVRHALLQVNDRNDEFQYHKFADVGLPDPPTNYMHMDTSYDVVKAVFYLSEVTERNGPFCYVPGSPRLKTGWLERIVRRATDRAGLSGYARETRELFAALPAPLRQKCTFGSDLPEDAPEARALVAAEYRFTSRDGNLGLFDNHGIHRGAIVEEGERRALFVLIA